MPRDKQPDSTGAWLNRAIVSFILMLLALYLGQHLPSLLYVVLVLGLLLFSFASLLIYQHLELFGLGKRVAALVRDNPRNAWAVLVLAGVAVALKLLGIW